MLSRLDATGTLRLTSIAQAQIATVVMSTRLDDVPAHKVETTYIEAARFNRVKLALLRLDNPIRLSLPGLKGMDVILEEETWVCVDRTLYDLPVIAWTDFDVLQRDNLHKPILCKQLLYHVHASVIIESVLSSMDFLLDERLRPLAEERATGIEELFECC